MVSGYLYGVTGDVKINLINALARANEKGIKLTVTKSSSENVTKTLQVIATVGNTKFTVVGKQC